MTDHFTRPMPRTPPVIYARPVSPPLRPLRSLRPATSPPLRPVPPLPYPETGPIPLPASDPTPTDPTLAMAGPTTGTTPMRALRLPPVPTAKHTDRRRHLRRKRRKWPWILLAIVIAFFLIGLLAPKPTPVKHAALDYGTSSSPTTNEVIQITSTPPLPLAAESNTPIGG